MSCEYYIELMSAVLDGQCTPAQRRELEEHLKECSACAARFEELRRQTAALRELDCQVPADLTGRIMNNLPQQKKAGKVIHWKRWGSIAACLVVVCAIGAALPGTMNGESAAPGAKNMASKADMAEGDVQSVVEDRDGDLTGYSYGPAQESASQPSSEPQAQASQAPETPQASQSPKYGDVPSETPDASDQQGTNEVPPEKMDPPPTETPAPGADLAPGLIPGQNQDGNQGGIIPGSGSVSGAGSGALENSTAFRVSYGGTPEPGAIIIGSVEELKEYLGKFNSLMYDGQGNEMPVPSLEGRFLAYDEEFFADHRLLCVVVEAPSGSIRYELDGNGLTGDTR